MRHGCCLFLIIIAALWPVVKLKIVKQKTKKFIQHRLTSKSKSGEVYGNPEVLTVGFRDDSRPGSDTLHQLWEQQENKSDTA